MLVFIPQLFENRYVSTQILTLTHSNGHSWKYSSNRPRSGICCTSTNAE